MNLIWLNGKPAATEKTEPLRAVFGGRTLADVSQAGPAEIEAAIAGTGVIYLFEDWLRPHLDSGALEPILEPWWLRFSGPFLYYSGRQLVPAPLRAFIDFVKNSSLTAETPVPLSEKSSTPGKNFLA